MPELRHLRAFLAVAEEGSFTAGAARLFLSQQQLSRQVAQMEGELGVRLFERTTRSVELTSAGERMLDQARHAVRAADAAFAGTQEFPPALRVDISSSGLETGAMILERLRGREPGLAVHQVERGVRWGLGALQRGELDLLLGDSSGAPHEIGSRLLRHEPILVGMADDHPLADRDFVTFEELRAWPLLLPSDDSAGEWNTVITGLCREAGFVPRRHAWATHGQVGASELLRGGEVVTPTLPWRAPPPDLVFPPVVPAVTYPMSAMWLGEEPSGAVGAFLGAAEELAGELGWRVPRAAGTASDLASSNGDAALPPGAAA